MLPYNVKLLYNSNSIAKIKDRIEILRGITIGYTIWFETDYTHSEYESTSGSYEHFKPYLRPMESMTEDEFVEYKELDLLDYSNDGFEMPNFRSIAWFLKKHFDFCGLIPKGLALPAPEGMYEV